MLSVDCEVSGTLFGEDGFDVFDANKLRFNSIHPHINGNKIVQYLLNAENKYGALNNTMRT